MLGSLSVVNSFLLLNSTLLYACMCLHAKSLHTAVCISLDVIVERLL